MQGGAWRVRIQDVSGEWEEPKRPCLSACFAFIPQDAISSCKPNDGLKQDKSLAQKMISKYAMEEFVMLLDLVYYTELARGT